MRTSNRSVRAVRPLTFLLACILIYGLSPWAQADEAKRTRLNEKAKAIVVAMEESLSTLPELYESVGDSIVRVESSDNISTTGVIVSADGHVLVGNGLALANGTGSIEVKVHLSDGRSVTATAAGWSNWGLGVFKINAAGPWPAIELGSTRELNAGEPCLVLGYTPRGDTQFDLAPTARFGFIDRTVPTRWFTTTCFPGFFERPVVVGMDGRLLGIDTWFAGDQSYNTAVDVFVTHRDDLFAGRNLFWVQCPPHPDSIYRVGAGEHPELLRLRKTVDVLGPAKPPAPMSESELSEVRQIAERTTVRLVSNDRLGYDRGGYDRWSGVIVSEDGYILTCAHTDQLPGEKLTVCLSDGRDADAVALGTYPIVDVGLVKITTPGPWPFVEIAESSTLKPGDPLVTAGYPAFGEGKWLTERAPRISERFVKHRPYLLWSEEFDTVFDPENCGGMSGGGVFNRSGAYVATYMGQNHLRSEVAKLHWDDLKQINSIDTATGLPHPLRDQFVVPSKSVAQSVVEVLVDSKLVSVGIIVHADGWVLTKASLLDGNVSCRLPDQSVVEAVKRAESQENDLALLKIDVSGLSAAEFPDIKPPAITQALCAVGPGQTLKPGIVSIKTRTIPSEPRWNGEGTEDTPDGARVSRSTSLSIVRTKLEAEDIIVSMNDHRTPNVAALTQALESNLSGYCSGDLVAIVVRRKGTSMDLMTALPPAAAEHYWMMTEFDTPRRSGFAAVFDTDIELLQHEVGSPVIDVEGCIRGITIASRGRTDAQRGPTSVLPTHIAARVARQLMAEAGGK